MAYRRNAHKLYRLLLLAYPSEFRHEYGEQMSEVFAQRLAHENSLLLWFATLQDVALTAPREHLDILHKDLRHAGRVLSKAPGFTSAALLTLTLGIGLATTVFSLFNAVLLRGLPYADPSRLVYLWTPLPAIKELPRELAPSWSDTLDWRSRASSFTGITALQGGAAVVEGSASGRVSHARVLGNFFDVLGTVAQLGRAIHPSDDVPGRPLVAVISHSLWHSQFGGAPGILDRSIRIDGRGYKIIGVMPREFAFPHGTDLPLGSPYSRTEIWIPAALSPQARTDRTLLTDTPDAVIARLRPGKSAATAQAELAAIETRLAPLYTPDWRGLTAAVSPFLQLALEPVRPQLNLMMAAVILVLTIACANFAGLLLARGSERVHEIGIRTALGAGRARLIRQILTESVLLSVAGGALGTVVSFAALRVVARLNPGDIPRFEEAAVDGRVLFFGLVVSLVAGIAAGLYPALSAASVEINAVLREGGRGIAGYSARVRNLLIVAQVAIAVVLLACGGLLLRSYRNVLRQENGFASSTLTAEFIAAGQLNPPPVTRPELERWEKRLAAIHNLLTVRLQSLPGIQAVGWTDDLPLSRSEDIETLDIEGQSATAAATIHSANIRHVSSGYFEAMQIRRLSGRFFRSADVNPDPEAAPDSVIVSRSFARLYFLGRNAIGHRVRIRKEHWSTVIGIVEDVRHSSLETAPQPTIYWPSSLGGTLVVRADAPAKQVAAAMKTQAAAVNTGSTISEIKTMQDYVADASARRKFLTVLLTAFSVVAVFLALIGLYGLLAYAVHQRTAEIGLRMALGASRAGVVSLILSQGLRLILTGLAFGLTLSLWTARMLSSQLYGVTATDPVTFVAIPLLVLSVSGLACLRPALRASEIDPVKALRSS